MAARKSPRWMVEEAADGPLGRSGMWQVTDLRTGAPAPRFGTRPSRREALDGLVMELLLDGFSAAEAADQVDGASRRTAALVAEAMEAHYAPAGRGA